MAIDKTNWKTIKQKDLDQLGQDTFDKHKAEMEKSWLDKLEKVNVGG